MPLTSQGTVYVFCTRVRVGACVHECKYIYVCVSVRMYFYQSVVCSVSAITFTNVSPRNAVLPTHLNYLL